MNRLMKLAALLVVPLMVACSDNNDNNNPEPVNPAQLRVTHASADAPAVNVYVNGALALENVDFKQSSGLLEFAEPGTLSVEVRGILPDMSEVSVIGPVDVTLESGIRTDVFAIGDLFDAGGALSIAPKVLEPVTVEEAIADVRVSVLHAAPGVGAVDIYVTAPGDALANTTPIDAAFGDAAGPVSLAADTPYQVRITADGATDVVFDSGTLQFGAGTELVLAAVENTFKTGASPVTLLAVGPEGASEVLDVNMGGSVRVVHNSADTPPVDVLVNGTEVLDAVPFTGASAYSDIEAPAGTYNVVVAADADNSIAPIDADLTLGAGESFTAIAIGSFADSSIEALVTQDDRRNIATAAIVEVIHGSYLVAADIPVDVYLTADGNIADAAPAIPGLAYGETTGQLAITPGDYWITVTAAGDKGVVAFDTGATLALAAGVNYTVIARDPSAEEVSGNPLINVILLTD
ncbi:MAG: DUF4397 domain-containing protein [Halioglobus sp.]|nr:DUF4397 domain-containing protein [Halioglobus sp.]